MTGKVYQCCTLMTLVILMATCRARSDAFDFSISGGYSHAFNTRSTLFHSTDGAYVDADFAWKLPAPQAPLSLGFGVTGSGYSDRQGDSRYSGGYGYYYDNNLYSDVGFFEFEPRVALTLWSTSVHGLFLKPRLGLGVLVGNYAIDHYSPSGTYDYIDTTYHTGAAFEIRPALQVGYAWGVGAAGVEGSYMPAWGDFGKLGSHIQELRVGAFYTFRF